MKFKHYIVTRINCGYLTKTENPDTWFIERFKFLRDITLPSIQNQVCKNFTWLWLVDPDTPQEHKKLLEDLKPKNTKIITHKWIAYINEDAKDTDYVLTTRFDSDDAISENFAANLQALAQKYLMEAPLCINFPTGVYYFVNSEKAYFGNKKLANQFISLLEKTNGAIKTVYCKAHAELGSEFKMLWAPTSEPMWAWLIHDTQLSDWGAEASYIKMLHSPKQIPFSLKKFAEG